MKAINILNEFITSNDSNPSVQDEGLLLQAYELIKDDLIETSYSIKTVRLAHKIFGYLGDQGLQERIDTMRKYLDSNQKKSLEDQFWGRWELVDNLALLKKYPTMIEEQKAFLAWAQENMPSDRLLEVMYDSTQARGWVEEGLSEEWFEIYTNIINQIEPSESNREARVIYVETVATVLIFFSNNNYVNAATEVNRYNEIIHEDVSWDQYNKFYTRFKSYQLGLYSAQNDWLQYERIVNEVILKIIDCINREKEDGSITIDEICDMAHEIGFCLMWEKRYEQALPLFKYASQNKGTGTSHFFYAICVWAVHKDRETTLHHLHLAEIKVKGNGGLRSRYKQMFLEQEEFADVWEDEEFLSVFLTA